MTFADYQIKVYYHFKRQERESKDRLSAMRYIAAYLLTPHLDPKKSVPAINKIIPLPWENEVRQEKKLSKKQVEKQKAEMDEIVNSHKRFFEMQIKNKVNNA